jgi:hypothetical protein
MFLTSYKLILANYGLINNSKSEFIIYCFAGGGFIKYVYASLFSLVFSSLVWWPQIIGAPNF